MLETVWPNINYIQYDIHNIVGLKLKSVQDRYK